MAKKGKEKYVPAKAKEEGKPAPSVTHGTLFFRRQGEHNGTKLMMVVGVIPVDHLDLDEEGLYEVSCVRTSYGTCFLINEGAKLPHEPVDALTASELLLKSLWRIG